MINYIQPFLEVKRLEIQIDSILHDKIPNFKAGIILYNNIEVGDSPQMVKGRFQLFQESIFFDLQEKNLVILQELKNGDKYLKQLEQTLSRYRPL